MCSGSALPPSPAASAASWIFRRALHRRRGAGQKIPHHWWNAVKGLWPQAKLFMCMCWHAAVTCTGTASRQIKYTQREGAPHRTTSFAAVGRRREGSSLFALLGVADRQHDFGASLRHLQAGLVADARVGASHLSSRSCRPWGHRKDGEVSRHVGLGQRCRYDAAGVACPAALRILVSDVPRQWTRAETATAVLLPEPGCRFRLINEKPKRCIPLWCGRAFAQPPQCR